MELSKSGFAPLGVQPVARTKDEADQRANFRVRRRKRQLTRAASSLGASAGRGRVHGIAAPEVENRYSAAFL